MTDYRPESALETFPQREVSQQHYRVGVLERAADKVAAACDAAFEMIIDNNYTAEERAVLSEIAENALQPMPEAQEAMQRGLEAQARAINATFKKVSAENEARIDIHENTGFWDDARLRSLALYDAELEEHSSSTNPDLGSLSIQALDAAGETSEDLRKKFADA